VRRVFLAAIALVLSAGALAAQDLDGKWWKNSRLADRIGLSGDQVNEIEKIFVRTRPDFIDLRADLEKKQFLLQQALEDETADRKDLEKKMEAVENSRAELQKARQRMLLDIRQVMKPEQWQKLLQLREEFRARVQQQRREMKQQQAPRPEPSRPKRPQK
jgi:Spy/CpxP family protein refolding chaperone